VGLRLRKKKKKHWGFWEAKTLGSRDYFANLKGHQVPGNDVKQQSLLLHFCSFERNSAITIAFIPAFTFHSFIAPIMIQNEKFYGVKKIVVL
jgi:hypothetical protein